MLKIFKNETAQKVALAGLGAVGLGIAVLGITLDIRAELRDQPLNDAQKAAIANGFAQDGFAGSEQEYGLHLSDLEPRYDFYRLVTLDLGGCSLSDVTFDVVTNAEGDITDVDHYRFSGTVYPTVERSLSNGPVRRPEVQFVGPTITFNFEDRQELEQSLGENPCATLAHTLTLDDAIHELP